MARAHTPFPISGSAGNLTFVHLNGKVFLRQKAHFSKDKWKKNPEFAESRARATQFGIASKLACQLYSPVARRHKGLVQPYAHNKLIAAFVQLLQGREHGHKPIQPGILLQAIREFRFSANPDSLHIVQHGPAHSPDQLKVRLPRLPKAPDGHRLELRLQLIQLYIPSARWSKEHQRWLTGNRGRFSQDRTTEWMPTHLLPEAIDIPLESKPGQEPHITYLVAEVRQVNEATGRTISRHDLGSIQLAAVHEQEHAIQDKEAQAIPTTPAVPLPEWHKDPAQFIRKALARVGTASG